MVDFIVVAARFALAAVFLVAGATKLTAYGGFVDAVIRYEILSERGARVVGRWLPLAELGCGGLLTLGVLTVPVALVLAGLLVSFGLAIAVNLHRGRVIDCGCSGPGVRSKISWALVLRNGLLALTAIGVAVWTPAGASVGPSPTFGETTMALSAAAAAAIVGVVVTLTCVLVSATARSEAQVRRWEARRS